MKHFGMFPITECYLRLFELLEPRSTEYLAKFAAITT